MKRKTKAQRDAEQLAALRQRITDMYSGAQGSAWDNDGDFATAELLGNVMPVLQKAFGEQREHKHCWELWNLRHFNSPTEAAAYLYKNGYRA